MQTSYRTVYEGKQGEIEEKKSRFIATVGHVESEAEALEFLNSVRKRYYDARHNCYAYCIGKEKAVRRYSDDGEPSMTAGKPILDVIDGQNLCDSIIVVTRYFGGTLLGTGGLVRAYTLAAKEGLANSQIIEKKAADEVRITVDYHSVGKLMYLIAQHGYHQTESEYLESVSVVLLIPKKETEAFEKEITETFSGKAVFLKEKERYFAEVGKKMIFF